MGELKDLGAEEARKKLKELAEDVRVCMFCTGTGEIPFNTRPMATQEVDDNGDIWFLSGKESNKNFELKEDERVQLIYSRPSDSHYLSIYGKAYVTKDRAAIDRVWNDLAKAWFKEGKDDPSLTAIRVCPEDAYYWDTQHGRMISFLKIAISAVSGKQMDDGVEGKLSV